MSQSSNRHIRSAAVDSVSTSKPFSGQSINLRHLYPMSVRYIGAAVSSWAAILIILSIVLYRMDHYVTFIPRVELLLFDFEKAVEFLMLLVGGVLLLRVFYGILYFLTFTYRIENGEVIIRRGVLIRETGVFPLAHISAVYLQRNVAEFVWGLATVHFVVPGGVPRLLAYIPGLSRRTAEEFKEFITQSLLGDSASRGE